MVVLKDDSTQRTIETREWCRMYDNANSCKCKTVELGQYAVDKKTAQTLYQVNSSGKFEDDGDIR